MEKYLSALDIGSNSFHLVIAALKEDKTFEIIRRERTVMRIGTTREPNSSKTFITSAEMDEASALIASYKKISDEYNAPLEAFATSAVREALNNREFTEKVLHDSGVKVNILSGKREAELIYKGVYSSLVIPNKKLLCIDIGGGSAELILGVDGKTLWADSFKIGAVRLTKMFFPSAEITEKGIFDCKKYLEKETENLKRDVEKTGFDEAVGSSGAAQTACALINAMYGRQTPLFNNNVSFSKEDFLKIKDLVFSRKTSDERVKIAGMDPKKADIIPAGMLALEHIFNLLNIKSLLISSSALKEGVLYEKIEKLEM